MRTVLYRGALRLARRTLPLVAPLNAKLRRGLEGRREAIASLAEWAEREREPSRPLVWVHAPSVGEALMAQAIIAAMRRNRPDVQIAFTHFSPSAERLKGQLGADCFGYLPWDLPADVGAALDALRPTALSFVRTEIWPELVAEAQERGIPSVLVNAVLAEGSGRLGGPGRWLLGPAYESLSAVGAVSAEDARLFTRLGVARGRIHVTGDARFDQVWQRVVGHAAGGVRHAFGPGDDGRFTVVAGSTWPEDHRRLVPAIAEAARQVRLRLVVAPHEPDSAHLAELERSLGAAGLDHARLSELEGGQGPLEAAELAAVADPDVRLPPALVLDRLGVLADSYAAADLAYVGGGFGRDGLHSVVEPAALGVPVLFGPRHGNSREATELARVGGGIEVRSVAELRAAIVGMAAAPESARERGRTARSFVQERLGGAEANARLVLDAIR